jgi:hypothetical protein
LAVRKFSTTRQFSQAWKVNAVALGSSQGIGMVKAERDPKEVNADKNQNALVQTEKIQ